MDKIMQVWEFLTTLKGAILAFAIMYIAKEKVSRKDIIFRLGLVTIFAGQAGELVQYQFGFGDKFHDLAQAFGILTIWIAVGLLRCFFVGRCRAEMVQLVAMFIATVKTGKDVVPKNKDKKE